jgi:hypothetical protein
MVYVLDSVPLLGAWRAVALMLALAVHVHSADLHHDCVQSANLNGCVVW